MPQTKKELLSDTGTKWLLFCFSFSLNFLLLTETEIVQLNDGTAQPVPLVMFLPCFPPRLKKDDLQLVMMMLT